MNAEQEFNKLKIGKFLTNSTGRLDFRKGQIVEVEEIHNLIWSKKVKLKGFFPMFDFDYLFLSGILTKIPDDDLILKKQGAK